MAKTEFKNNRKFDEKLLICYNCGKQVDNQKQKYCRNCQTILNPNSYIGWKKSWFGFLCCLCLIPFLLSFLFLLLNL